MNWCHTCMCWKTNILNQHRNRGNMSKPGSAFDWTRLDSSLWPRDPAEMSRVFLPHWWTGTNPSSTSKDLSTLVFIISNCRAFDSKVPGAVLQDIRTIRNEFFAHNNEQKLTDSEKQHAFDCMAKLLHLPKLQKYASVQTALRILQKLSNVDLFGIITDIRHAENVTDLTTALALPVTPPGTPDGAIEALQAFVETNVSSILLAVDNSDTPREEKAQTKLQKAVYHICSLSKWKVGVTAISALVVVTAIALMIYMQPYGWNKYGK